MKSRKIVVALGGNAILSKDASAQAQQAALLDTARYLVEFIKQGDQLIISHGNGLKWVIYCFNKPRVVRLKIQPCLWTRRLQ